MFFKTLNVLSRTIVALPVHSEMFCDFLEQFGLPRRERWRESDVRSDMIISTGNFPRRDNPNYSVSRLNTKCGRARCLSATWICWGMLFAYLVMRGLANKLYTPTIDVTLRNGPEHSTITLSLLIDRALSVIRRAIFGFDNWRFQPESRETM